MFAFLAMCRPILATKKKNKLQSTDTLLLMDEFLIALSPIIINNIYRLLVLAHKNSICA